VTDDPSDEKGVCLPLTNHLDMGELPIGGGLLNFQDESFVLGSIFQIIQIEFRKWQDSHGQLGKCRSFMGIMNYDRL
jgi:hypothetical protein